MKNLIPVLLVMLGVSAGSFAQTPDPAIDKALLAAPAQARAAATVSRGQNIVIHEGRESLFSSSVASDREISS